MLGADAEKQAMVARWVEAKEPGRPPDRCRKTLRVEVEPYHSEYQELDNVIGGTMTRDEYGDWEQPDPEFWTPTPAMQAKLDRLEALEGHLFETVPNPDYDPAADCPTWRSPFAFRLLDSGTIKVVQPYTPQKRSE